MNIALVFPPFYHPSMYNLPPLGLLNLATLLRRAGHAPVILDQVLGLRDGSLPFGAGVYDACAAQVAATRPDIVAFSAQCTTYPPTLNIARRVRRLCPQARIVVGGHNASFVAAETLERFPFIDAVVRGEGEVTFPELAGTWAAGDEPASVAGVTWRGAGGIVANPERELIADLDVLPLPDYSLGPPLATYQAACELPRSIAILEVGRGCPHSCVYCSESVLWRRRCRTFNVERVVEEMRRLQVDQGAECFLLAYDQFTADRRFVETFCRQVIAAGLHRLAWYCISRLDTVDADLLGLMREAGCESMCYGIDSGSERTLAFIRKKIDPQILGTRVEETTARGMVPTLSFVVGFPEEERGDIDATLALALTTGLRGNSNPLMQIPTVLPGTELHHRYGATLVRAVDSYFALGLEFEAGKRLAEDEALIGSDTQLFSSFYNLPCRGMELPELARLANFFPLLVNLYPKSLLALATALDTSISELFAALLAFVAAREGLEEPGLTPPACYAHFPAFAAEKQPEIAAGWAHLPEIVAYESSAIEVAAHAPPAAVANIDLSGVKNWRPHRRQNVLVRSFAYDLPEIIEDLKAGQLLASYPEAPTWLVFRQEGGELEVTAVNRFGSDFLALCDGSARLDEIADRMYPQYGQDMNQEAFRNTCREAAASLNALHLLGAGSTESEERR